MSVRDGGWRLLLPGATCLTLVACVANPVARVGPSSWEPPQAVLPYDSAPVLVNEEEVSLEMRQAYPPELHAAGIGGRVEVWVRVSDEGAGSSRRIRTSSGHDALDCAGLQVASAMQFEPAVAAGLPAIAWVAKWVEFEPDPSLPPPRDRPRCEPFDTPPAQLNPSDVRKWLEWFYPKDLQAKGVGGRVELWLFVDASGDISEYEVKVSSGVEALDRAAVKVGTMLRFTPAKSLGIPTGVWVSQWINFEVMNSRPAG